MTSKNRKLLYGHLDGYIDVKKNLIHNQTVQIESTSLSFIDEYCDSFEVKCTLWGDVSKPLVVLLGGISADRWALDCQDLERAGWWRQVVNQHSYLNIDNFCFLTFDYLVFPERFINPPVITTNDQANILSQIQVGLKLPQFYAVIGSSYGGMVALAFAAQFPTALAHLICIAAADYNSVKSQALRSIQRKIIQLGNQSSAGGDGAIKNSVNTKSMVALARSLAMVGYRGEAELEDRFQSKMPGLALDKVSAYLQHKGEDFAENFAVSRYLQLSQSIDFHSVDVSTIQVKTQLIGISTDQMVPVKLVQDLRQKINNNWATTCEAKIIDSNYGHDGFLLEGDQLNQIFRTFFNEKKHDYFKPNNRSAGGH